MTQVENLNIAVQTGFCNLPGEGLLIYHFADGSMATDKTLKWDHCRLHELMKLELHVLGKKYVIEAKNCPNFVEFIHKAICL